MSMLKHKGCRTGTCLSVNLVSFCCKLNEPLLWCPPPMVTSDVRLRLWVVKKCFTICDDLRCNFVLRCSHSVTSRPSLDRDSHGSRRQTGDPQRKRAGGKVAVCFYIYGKGRHANLHSHFLGPSPPPPQHPPPATTYLIYMPSLI